MENDDMLEVVANDVQIEVDTLRCFHLDRIFDGHVQLFAYFASFAVHKLHVETNFLFEEVVKLHNYKKDVTFNMIKWIKMDQN